jgi:hypothetical protein
MRNASLVRGRRSHPGEVPDHFLVNKWPVKAGQPIEVRFPAGWKRGHLVIRPNGRHDVTPFFECEDGIVQIFPGRTSVRVP